MDFKKSAISGTKWSMVSYGWQALVQVLRLSILTRYLEKSDFGLVAIVVLILGFTQIFADLGVSVSLFSKENITKKEYSSLYWVGLILSVFLYGLLLLISPLIAGFYKQVELNHIIPIMGLDLIISTTGRQFRIFRQKGLDFKSLAIIDITALSISLIVAVFLAMNGFGVYSLVLSTLTSSILTSAFLIFSGLKSHPLIFYLNFTEGKSFYKIGFYQTGSQILDYLSSQLDVLILGKVLPISELGVYNLIKQLVVRIYGLLNQIVTSVSIPVLSRMKSDMSSLSDKYLQMVSSVSLANLGIYAILAIFAKEVLFLFYGKAYVVESLNLQVLCLWGCLISVSSASSTIIVIMGRTDVGFKWTIIRLIINPIFIFTGARFGLLGMIVGQVLFVFLSQSIYWKVVINRIVDGISLKKYLRVGILPFIKFVPIVFLIIFLDNLLVRSAMFRFDRIIILLITFTGIYYFLNKKIIIGFLNDR